MNQGAPLAPTKLDPVVERDEALLTEGADQGVPVARVRGRVLRLMRRPLLVLAAILAALAIIGYSYSGKPVAAPDWVVRQLEQKLNAQLDGRARLSLGGIAMRVSLHEMPELRLSNLRLSPAGGGGSILLPEAYAHFDSWGLVRGRVTPATVRIIGAQIRLRRLEDGTFDVVFDTGDAEPPASFAELLGRVERLFNTPLLAPLRRLEAEAISFTLEDRRAGQSWTMGDGRTSLTREGGEMVLEVGASLVGGGQSDARAQMQFRILPQGQGVRLSARVDAVAARDIALQSPLLALLGVMDAPISGQLRADLSATGAVRAFDGQLSLGQGALSPVAGARAVALNRAEVAFGFDPAASRLNVSQIKIESPEARLTASGHVDLKGLGTGIVPEAFVTQLRLSDVQIDPQGMFQEPVRFTDGALDMRLKLDPFSVDLGQMALVEDGRRVAARGQLAATPDGWTVALDLELDKIEHQRLLAMWPTSVVPRTRVWLVDNVQQGTLFDVKAALRLRPNQEPRLSLGYEFEGADVRFMKTLPPIRDGRGYAMLEGKTYTTVVESGRVTPPEGGDIAVSHSVFRVPDFTQRPAPAEIVLNTESPIRAALSLLDQPPFHFMERAGLGPDLAEGRAVMRTTIKLPLAPKVTPQDVIFEVSGDLHEVLSDNKLIKGRVLSAPKLQLHATNERVEIFGAGRLGQAQFDGRWRMEIGPGKSGSRATAGVTIDEGFVAEFLQALPKGSVTGKGGGRVEIELPKGQAPRLSFSSDLVGVAVSIPEIGWRKPAQTKGELRLSGNLSAPLVFEKVRLAAAGLVAEGRLSLRPTGGLEKLALSKLRVGDWLQAEAALEGHGAGQPLTVSLSSGTLDIRHLPEGRGVAGAGTGAGSAIEVALDRVIVSEALSLQRVRGRLRPKSGGLDGAFNALVNGQAPVRGQLVAGPRGMGVRLQAENGGAALAAAKIFGKADGGVLDLALTPTGRRGHYEGSFNMSNFTVRNLPALAELLNAASIVGLIDQLASSGVVFSGAQGNFSVTPKGIEVRGGHAVGASFGVSLEGVYRTTEDWLDLQGVISPFYLVNSIGQVLTRPGEGVMGFTYRIKGRAADPKVSLNPLSVLAPGFFRDLLRRPPARLEGIDAE